jgi:hypothetical protein
MRATTAPAKIASTSHREMPWFRFRSCRTCAERPTAPGILRADFSRTASAPPISAGRVTSSETRTELWRFMPPILSLAISTTMRGSDGGAKRILWFRQNDAAVLFETSYLQGYHFRNAVPLRHNSLPPAAVPDLHRSVLQPFNSANILGSNEIFASAASLLKYSNPQEGPK